MHAQPRTLTIELAVTPGTAYAGICWPASRDLSNELADLLARWPATTAAITRILFSRPDWDEHPRSVQIGARRLKTGSFPGDDTHLLTISQANGSRLRLLVIPPDCEPTTAREVLEAANDPSWSASDYLAALGYADAS